ncbi:NAD(P)-binding protein [Chryseobacterium capnotolerans]|uniref:NAD(P)-binding protein n=1 Tax=Chryseobacterium capnotolerans TaxID=2759528 RepID=UPI001E47CAAD|nr:FAD/NAD(P)-binding protein [Chryseobacterium capnotolerans]
MNKIAVVGAGISGLSMANYLEKHKIDYHIYERRKKEDLAGHGFLIPQEGIEYLTQIIDPSLLFKHGSFLKKYIQYSHTGKKLQKRTSAMCLQFQGMPLYSFYQQISLLKISRTMQQ